MVESLEVRTLLAVLAVDTGDRDCDESRDNLYCQIQEAVDVAEPGDIIVVEEGRYDSVVISTDDLTIEAMNSARDVVIDAEGAVNGVELNADQVFIKGLDVQDASGHGFLVKGNNNTLEENSANGNGGDGFHVLFGDNNRLTGNTAENNGSDGFKLVASDVNLLEDNFARRNERDGFGLFASDSNLLKRNDASRNGRDGFGVIASDNNVLAENSASRNTGDAFQMGLSNGNTLRDNITERNGGSGFELSSSDGNAVTRNDAFRNGLDGFTLTISDNNTVEDNIARENRLVGYAIDSLMSNSFVDNECEDNELGGDNQGGAICRDTDDPDSDPDPDPDPDTDPDTDPNSDATLILDENNPANALGIDNLLMGGILYNVDFVLLAASSEALYGPAPGTFDFTTKASADEAVNAVIAVLNGAAGVVSVGPAEVAIFDVAFNFSQPFGIGSAEVVDGFFREEAADWLRNPDVNFRVYIDPTSYADFEIVPEPAMALIWLPGDADADGRVALSDFLILFSNFGLAGKSFSDGDFDGDGQVQFSDFLILSDNFGESRQPALAPALSTISQTLPMSNISAADDLFERFDDELSLDDLL